VGYTVYYETIPEYDALGVGRLGRHVKHDSRSLDYLFQVPEDAVINSVRHTRNVPVLDQGNLGSCTGNAATGAVGTSPVYEAYEGSVGTKVILNEAEAVKLYSAATALDSYQGTYPPNDTGSDGLSVAKAAKAAGLISGYQHATDLNTALVALQTYPVIIGVNWYEGFDNPDANGLVKVSGQVRGGHEFVVDEVDVVKQLVGATNSWGTSFGVNGRFYFSYADFTRLLKESGDVTVLLPLTVPAPTPTPPGPPTPTPTPSANDLWTAILKAAKAVGNFS
jgi:hypothetical protein